MFQSGSQINPALGRTDYSAYTQGAAQGAQAIGQGMQQLGQGIGAAVKEYKINKEKKEQEKAATAAIKSYLIKNQDAAEALGIDPLDDGAIKAASKNYGGPAGLISLVNQQEEMNFRKQQRTQQDADSIAAANAQGLNQSYDFGPNGVPNFGGEAINTAPPQISPAVARSMLAAQAARQQQEKFETDISYTKSQTDKAKVQKQKPFVFGKPEDATASVAGVVKGNPSLAASAKWNSEGGGWEPVVQSVTPAPESSAKKYGIDYIKDMNEMAKAIPQAIESDNKVLSLLKSGNVNIGAAGPVKQWFDKVIGVAAKPFSKAASDTEVLQALLDQSLFSRIQTMGLTTKAFDTPAEKEQIMRAYAGAIKNEPDSLKQLAEWRIKTSRKFASEYETAKQTPAFRSFMEESQRPALDLSEYTKGELKLPPGVSIIE
jgi:hypothetical protein